MNRPKWLNGDFSKLSRELQIYVVANYGLTFFLMLIILLYGDLLLAAAMAPGVLMAANGFFLANASKKEGTDGHS